MISLCLLALGLVVGYMGSLVYLFPDFLKDGLGFIGLRSIHESASVFFILLGATGSVYYALDQLSPGSVWRAGAWVQLGLWVLALVGIFGSYFAGIYGGREYWSFPAHWALPIALAWALFIVVVVRSIRSIKGQWPVYVWMWLTGAVFFLVIFMENYFWVIPYFRQHLIGDMTVQWKVNGTLVGAWNQLVYGTAFYLADKISGNRKVGRDNLAFAMYFLGFFNMVFNWGHHVYTLPTADYVKHVGYAVSMTEWVIFIKIMWTWRKNMEVGRQRWFSFPYRFLLASDIWVAINLVHALFLSIPAVNVYLHGTHSIVAHAMGTTIGINSMVLMAAVFVFLGKGGSVYPKWMTGAFWAMQASLLVFWLSLNGAGIQKAIWQMAPNSDRGTFGEMMTDLGPWFWSFSCSGLFLMLCFLGLIMGLIRRMQPLANN
jgi:nitric oxide reductase subunit B